MALTAAERQAARRLRQADLIESLRSENARLTRLLADTERALDDADGEVGRLSSGGAALCRTCRGELACPRCYRSGDDF